MKYIFKIASVLLLASCASAQTVRTLQSPNGKTAKDSIASNLSSNQKELIPIGVNAKHYVFVTPNSGTQTYVAGDLLYAGGTNNYLSRLAIGTTNYVLTVSSGLPGWVNINTLVTLPHAVLYDPANVTTQVIQPTASIPGLAVKAFGSGSAHLLDLQNSSGAVGTNFTHSGALFVKPFADNLAVTVESFANQTADLLHLDFDNGSSVSNKFAIDVSGNATAVGSVSSSHLKASDLTTGVVFADGSGNLTNTGTISGFVKTSPAATSDNVITGTSSIIGLTAEKDALGTSTTIAQRQIELLNATPATGSVTRQWSPSLSLAGTAWDGTGSQTNRWIIQGRPLANSGSTDNSLAFSSSINGVSTPTPIFTLNSTTDAVLVHALDMSSNFIHNVTDPAVAQDAATKAYVDAHAGTGTVTSVDVSGGATGLTTSGGPITTSGTITLAGNLTLSHLSNGTTSTVLVTNSSGTASWEAVTDHAVILGNTTNALGFVSGVGTSGQVLTSNGAGADPTWQTASGGVTSVSDDGGATLTISPTSGAVLAGINLAHANIWTALQTGNANGIATTGTYRLALTNTTASTALVPNQQSPSLKVESHGWNAADITNTWSIYSGGGANVSSNKENLSFELDQGSGVQWVQKLYYTGITSAKVGYWVNGSVPTAGHFLRSDGSAFLDGTIQAGDLPSLGGSYIQNQTSSQSSASFNITNNVATTAQVASTYTSGTATALTLTANTSNSGHPNQGLTFNVSNASGSANDIVGTSTNWKVTSAGDATLNSATLGTPLTVANGGTGVGTLAAHSLFVGNGTGAITAIPPGTAGYVLTSGGGSGDPLFSPIPTVVTMLGAYGDGSDGDVALNATNTFTFATLAGSTYTLTRSVYAHNFTTSSSAIVKTNGYAIFATGTVTNGSGSTIHCNGNNATVGLNGQGAASNTSTLFPGGPAGKPGPSTVSAGTNGNTVTLAYGGSGGAGGADGAGHAGGTTGTATAPAANVGSVHAFPMMYYGGFYNNSGLTWWNASGGGASGGNNGAGTSISGNGGGGAGTVAIYAQTISNSGTISANGGNGSTSAQVGLATGGGGGGGGGFVLLVTNSFSGTNPTVTGGTHGNGTAGGSNGSDGNSGTYLLILNQ